MVTVTRRYHGPKPSDAQFMASSQRGEPLGAWLESSRVSEPFHVRPGASGDGPRYVAGTAPRGQLFEGHHAQCHAGRERTYPCDVSGAAQSDRRVGPHVLHVKPCQQMPTLWARGIPPGASATFHRLAWCRGHGMPAFSPHLAP